MSDAAFHTTRWSLILQAGLDDEPQAEQALAELCQAYWYPLYGYARRSGFSQPDAEDLIQSYFAHLLERQAMKGFDPDKGRFRSYLLGGLKNHLINQQRHTQARKRGGMVETVSIDADTGEKRLLAEAADGLDPEKLFHRGWAQAVLNRALDQLRASHQDAGKAEFFELMEPFLVGNPSGVENRDGLAERLNTTANALNIKLHRLRKRYGDLVREAIADTVSSPGEVDDELRFLMTVLRNQA